MYVSKDYSYNLKHPRPMKTSLLRLAISCVVTFVGSSAFAANETWQGGAGNWNSTNWGPTGGPSGSAAPGAVGSTATGITDTASFTSASAGTVVVDPYRDIKTITFDGGAGAFTLSGGPLLLTANGGINLGTGAATFLGSNTVETVSAPIVLNANSTSFVNNSTNATDVIVISGTINPAGSATPTLTLGGANTGTNTISGIIQNSGAHAQPYGHDSNGPVNLSKTGAGTWILTAANTFSGTTAVGGGTLQLNNSLALQNSQVSINSINGLAFQGGLGSFNVAGLDGGSNQALTDLGGSAGVTVVIGTNWANNTNSDSYTGTLTGAGGVTKYGYNNETFSANQLYSGTTTVNGFNGVIASSTGKLISTLSGTGTPFGTGAIALNGGTLALTPSTTGATSLTGATSVTSGAALTYGSGSFLALTKKDSSSSLTYTIGGGGTASLVRNGNGTLVIQTGNTGDLGAGENLLVNGTAPTVVTTNGNGGMVSASIVGLGTTTASQLDFLNYNSTNGFTVATYMNHTTGFTTTAGEIANVSNVTVTDSGADPYAIRAVSGFTIASGNTLTVGDGTTADAAGIILGGNIASGGTGSTLNFGASEGIIYSEAAAKIAPIITGTGGITLSGSGTSGLNANSAGSSLELDNTGNTFTGTITVNTGANLVAGGAAFNNNVLGNANNSILLNGGGLTTDNSPNSNNMFLGRSIVLGAQGGVFQGSENVADSISGSGALYINTKAFVQGPIGSVPNVLVDLTGHNTFTGGLVLTQGIAVVSSSQNLGAATNPIQFTEGVLDITGTTLTSFGSHPVSFAANYNTNQVFNIDIQNANNNFTVGQTLGQTVIGIAKFGLGTLTLTTPYIDGINEDFYGGSVVFDASQGGSQVDYGVTEVPGTTLNFYGGTVDFKGTNSTTGTTTMSAGDVNMGITGFGGVNASQVGGTLLADNNGGNLVVNLGSLRSQAYAGYGYSSGNTIQIANGGSLQIQAAGTGTSTITVTNAPDATGIYGSRVVYTDASGNTNWATGTQIGSTGTYTLSGYTGYTAFNPGLIPTTASKNYSLDAASSLYFTFAPSAAIAANSLKVIADSATNTNMDLNGQVLTLASGGLLFTGNNDFTISDGTITSGLAGANINNSGVNDLIIQQYSSTNTLTIGAAITNGSAASMSLTKAGPGTLVLTGPNTYTGNTFLNGGTLSLASTNFGSTRMLVFNGGTLQVTGAANWTKSIAALAGGIQVGGEGATIDVENGGNADAFQYLYGGQRLWRRSGP